MSRQITCDFYCDKILTGLQVVPVCFENERVFAFHHTNPLWEHHVVLLPKKHIDSLLALEEADNDLLLELMRTAKMIPGISWLVSGPPACTPTWEITSPTKISTGTSAAADSSDRTDKTECLTTLCYSGSSAHC